MTAVEGWEPFGAPRGITGTESYTTRWARWSVGLKDSGCRKSRGRGPPERTLQDAWWGRSARGILSGAGVCGFPGGEDGGVDGGRDPDADSTHGEAAATGIQDAPCESRTGRGIGGRMLQNVKPIKLGRQMYRRLMKRVL